MRQMQLSHDVTLYQGDALQILASLLTPNQNTSPSVSHNVCLGTWADAVLTDPPYCSGGTSMMSRQADPASKYQSSGTKRCYPPMLGDAKDQRSWTHWCTLWLTECWRLAKDGAPLMVFTDWRQLPALTDAVQAAGWKWLGIVPWDKGNARPQTGKFRQQCEYVVFASKGSFKPGSKQCLPGLYKYPVIARQKVHLTSKPVALVRDLLAVTAPNAVVLDPFMGGGTTGVACVESGRRFVGIELSEAYFDVSVRRLEEAMGTPR